MQLATIRAEIERMPRQQISDGRIAEPLDTDAAGQAAAHRSVRNIQRRPSASRRSRSGREQSIRWRRIEMIGKADQAARSLFGPLTALIRNYL